MAFAVTGLGRSGTTWLAHQLNHGDHSVRHESDGDAAVFSKPPQWMVARFDRRWKRRPCYGEVNSYLRRCIHLLDVEHRALIIRHPASIWDSACRWRPSSRGSLESRINKGLRIIHAHAAAGIPVYKIEEVGSDIGALAAMASDLGIRSFDTTRVSLKPENQARAGSAPKCPDTFDWFVKGYYGTAGRA